MIARLLTLAALIAALLTPALHAHELQPGLLELRSLNAETWRVYWKKPAVSGRPMQIEAVLPEICDIRRAPETLPEDGAFAARWAASCPEGLQGGTIEIAGLPATRTDVLVRYEPAPGAPIQTHRLTADEPAFTIPEPQGPWAIFTTYTGLGIEHILEGIDHLLFVLALVLLIRHRGRLIGAVTAFTVAHSITLAASALGWIVVPIPPVEAIIALSIVFLAVELAKGGGSGARLSERYPWTVSFSFGLLHGFGFASALKEIGLPQGEIPLALLAFNIGVELGQLLFIAAVLITAAILARLVPHLMQMASRPGGPGLRAASYAIGGTASYWMIDRIAGF